MLLLKVASELVWQVGSFVEQKLVIVVVICLHLFGCEISKKCSFGVACPWDGQFSGTGRARCFGEVNFLIWYALVSFCTGPLQTLHRRA